MPNSDFNGDGRDDILWRSSNGTISNWLATASGGFTVNDNNAFAEVGTAWIIIGSGDFNGDGRDDILWVNSTTRAMSNWLGTVNGGWQVNDGAAFMSGVDPIWGVLGIGDFNGDGRDDVLLVNENSNARTIWLAETDGGFNSTNPMDAPDGWSWTNLVGDFNGDGRDDILWYGVGDVGNWSVGNWLATNDGQFVLNNQQNPVGAGNWHILGVGDFNGDGRDDLLWRSDSGGVSNWLATAQGGFTVNDSNAFRQVPTDWHVVGIGDYNGDGRDDILWRNSNGTLSNWLGTASGGFTINDANALTSVPIAWEVQFDRQDPTWIA
jgi:hypothetical protein